LKYAVPMNTAPMSQPAIARRYGMWSVPPEAKPTTTKTRIVATAAVIVRRRSPWAPIVATITRGTR
jgi:hypothetical protein